MSIGSTKQLLSSRLTFVYKFVLPTVWIGGSVGATIMTLFSESKSVDGFLLFLLFGCVFLYFFCIPLKFIKADKQYLYVSNARKTIQVPISEIEEVGEILYLSIHPVWIKFRKPTEFGTKVIFMPYSHAGNPFPHPVVSTLRNMAKLC